MLIPAFLKIFKNVFLIIFKNLMLIKFKISCTSTISPVGNVIYKTISFPTSKDSLQCMRVSSKSKITVFRSNMNEIFININ